MRSRRGGRSARRRHACPKGRPTELSSVPGSRIAAQVTMQALDEDAAANLAARPTMLGGAPNVRLHAKLTRRASEGPRATFRTAEAAQNTIEHPRLQSDIQSERRTCRRPKQTPTGTAQGLRRNDPSLDGVDPPSCPHPPRTIGCVVFTTCGIRSVGPCGIRKVLWFWAYVLPFVFWGAGGRVSAGLMAGERGVTFSSPLPSKGLARQKPALHHVSPQRVYSQPAPPAPPVAHPPNAAASAAAAARKPADAAILLQNVEKNKQAPSAAVTKKSVRLEQEVSAEAPPREPAAPEWMKPKRATKPPPKPLFEPRKSGRPSLSEQLAGLSAKTETITAGIKQSLVKGEDDGKEAAKLLCQCDRFVVGRVKGTFSSPVQFFGNRLLYAFIHPTKERIEMRMMYEHMSEIRLDDAAMTFRFRIRKPIGTTFYGWFNEEYEPTNANHCLQVGFEAKRDWASFKGKIMPIIHSASGV